VSGNQIAYAVILALLTYPAWGRQRYALVALWCNMLAILAICLAMDLSAISRDMATVSMMIADLATGAALSLRTGASRVIALGYAVTVPIYSVNLAFGLPISATFGVVYIAAFTQLGVLAIGSFGGDGGGGRRRRAFIRPSLAAPRGNPGVYQGAISGRAPENRVS
jgi:hypothetical protein